MSASEPVEPAPAATVTSSWILRLLGPLLGWILIALGLWQGLAYIIQLSPLAAALVSMVAVFLTTSLYVYLACRDGAYPKRAWWLAPVAILGSVALSFLLHTGGSESLVTQMAMMSFFDYPEEYKRNIGMVDNLVRLALGLEDTDDLVADLQQALARI